MKAWLHERLLPLKHALHTALGPVLRRTCFVVEVRDDAGLSGYGEAAPLPAFGGEDVLACREALDAALPALPLIAEDWLLRSRPDAPLGPLERRFQNLPVARAAVEGALLDLLAKRKGLPLARLLAGEGAEPSETLPVNALLAGDDLIQLADGAATLAERGWTTLKVKLSGDLDQDLALVRALRQRLGRDLALRADANGSYSRADATAFCIACRELNLEFLEQPLQRDDLEGAASLRRLAGPLIAADESVRDAADVGRVAAAQAADLIILKPIALGGWRPTLRAAELARSMGLDIGITTFLDGAIGRAHASHIAAALGCSSRAQGLATGSLLAADCCDRPLHVSAGILTLRQEPGLGVGEILAEPMRVADDDGHR